MARPCTVKLSLNSVLRPKTERVFVPLLNFVPNIAPVSRLPVYGIAAVTLFVTARYIDNKFIRPPSKTGFGKGAPGFITNTRKLKVTPEIAARLRRGEQVSPEEIEAAVKDAEAKAAAAEATEDSMQDSEPSSPPRRRSTRNTKAKEAAKSLPPSKHVPPKEEPASDANEWIPETHTKKPSQRRKQK